MNRFQFYQDVYSIVAEIPFGRVLSYGQIARLAGNRNVPGWLDKPCFMRRRNFTSLVIG